MSKKTITDTRKVISAEDLLARWTGITEEDLAELIDKSNADHGDKQPAEIKDFPQAYTVVRMLREKGHPNTILTSRVSCRPNYSDGERYERPYTRVRWSNQRGKIYEFTGIVFLLKEVKAYENAYPRVLWEIIRAEDLPLARNSKQQKDMGRLKSKIARLTKEKEELALQLAQSAIATTTTVNAERWRQSTRAVLSVVVEIIHGKKRGWIKDDFCKKVAALYPRCIIEVKEEAWKALPTVCKQGSGRPLKKTL